jgi:hypothetical protein
VSPKQSRQHCGRPSSHQSRCAATPSAKTCANNSHCPADAHMIIQILTSDGGGSEAESTAAAALRSRPRPAPTTLTPVLSKVAWPVASAPFTDHRQPEPTSAWLGSSPSSCLPRLCFSSGAHPSESHICSPASHLSDHHHHRTGTVLQVCTQMKTNILTEPYCYTCGVPTVSPPYNLFSTAFPITHDAPQG